MAAPSFGTGTATVKVARAAMARAERNCILTSLKLDSKRLVERGGLLFEKVKEWF